MSCGMSSIGEKEPGERTGGRIRAAVMLFGTGDRFRLLCGGRTRAASFIRTVGGSEDVIFSKERVRTHFMADEEQGAECGADRGGTGDFRPGQSAHTDYECGQRRCHGLSRSLALALDSEDTETSHHAASVLPGCAQRFQATCTETLTGRCKRTGREAGDDACLLIEATCMSS